MPKVEKFPQELNPMQPLRKSSVLKKTASAMKFHKLWVLIVLTISPALSAFSMSTPSPVTQRLYLLPGLGSDIRAFQWFREELDPSIEVIALNHTTPLEGELMPDLAKRVLAQIDTTQPFSILGCSFGGMVAVEISKLVEPEQLILIGSAKGESEIPVHYKMFRRIPAYSLLKGDFLLWGTEFLRPLFEPNGKDFYEINSAMMREADPDLLPRAVHCIVQWDNQTVPNNLTHLHGTKDNVLPYRRIKDKITIEGGPHMMIMTHASEIAAIVNQILCATV